MSSPASPSWTQSLYSMFREGIKVTNRDVTFFPFLKLNWIENFILFESHPILFIYYWSYWCLPFDEIVDVKLYIFLPKFFNCNFPINRTNCCVSYSEHPDKTYWISILYSRWIFIQTYWRIAIFKACFVIICWVFFASLRFDAKNLSNIKFWYPINVSK